jgi:proteasome assembly chaperone (PAC2) family protein
MNDISRNETNYGFFIETKLENGLTLENNAINNFNDLKNIIKDPVCIQGMPGMADIGKMCVDQLVVLLEAKKIMDIMFDDFPAGAVVSDSILYSPRAEVYLYFDPDRKQDLLILTSDAQPMSPRGIHAFSRFLAKLINFFGAKLVISLGAFPVESPSNKNHIYITGTSNQVFENFSQNKNITKLSKGVIIGSNGLVPTLCKNNYGIEGLILLAETNGFEAMKKDAYDVKASMTLLQVISKEFSLDFDDQNLEKEMTVETLEAKIKDEKESIKKEINSSKKKPMTLPYFG